VPPSWRRFAPPIIIALVTFAAFSPGLGGEFLNWDDDKNFLENPSYRGLGLDNLRWMFTTFIMGHWHPLTWLSLGVDYTLWGMNPVGYHVTSLLLHSANAALLYLVLVAFLRLAGHPDLRWPAAIGALFYALHPLRVESVSWITERRDVMCGLFTLLTVYFYLRHVETDKDRWIQLSCACFAGALMSKALAITLPGALLLMDIYPLRRLTPENRKHVLLEKVPFFVLSFADAAVMNFAMRHIDAVHSAVSYNVMERIAQAAYGLCFYVVKTICPVGLAPLYRIDPNLNPWAFVYLGSMVAVVALTAVLFVRRRAWPGALATWLAYAGLVLPVLGVAVTGRQIAADRYTYLALLPVSVLIARLLAKADRPPVRIACAAGLLVLAGLTARQTLFWKDSMTLWERELSIDPNVAVAYLNRGSVLQAKGDLAGAAADYDRSIALDPADASPWYNRGVTKALRGDHAGAIEDFTSALERRPGHANALASRGRSRAQRNDPGGALADFDESLRLQPDPANYLLRARLRGVRGDVDGSIADCSEALRLRPDYADAYSWRAMGRMERGDSAGAVSDLLRALEVAPPGWTQRKQVEQLLRQIRGK
jgi:protein O-mannosyl-transferase